MFFFPAKIRLSSEHASNSNNLFLFVLYLCFLHNQDTSLICLVYVLPQGPTKDPDQHPCQEKVIFLLVLLLLICLYTQCVLKHFKSKIKNERKLWVLHTLLFNPKKAGLFWRLERRGVAWCPPWDFSRWSRDHRKNLHNDSVWCNLQDSVFKVSKIVIFFLWLC